MEAEDRRPRIAVAVPESQADTRYRNYFDTMNAFGAVTAAAGPDVNPADFDGLLLPGGVDVNPCQYGRCNMGCEMIDDALDALQMGALDAFVKAGKPVFGICRGHQLINVYFGGTLIQHLPQALTHCRCGAPMDKAHGSRAEKGSVIHSLFGEVFPVNSAHHQGVETPGKGLRTIQWADDGVIEAMQHVELPVLCVQWHPERTCLSYARPDTVDGSPLLKYFVQMCGRMRRAH